MGTGGATALGSPEIWRTRGWNPVGRLSGGRSTLEFTRSLATLVLRLQDDGYIAIQNPGQFFKEHGLRRISDIYIQEVKQQ